jgi:hypothetical protein
MVPGSAAFCEKIVATAHRTAGAASEELVEKTIHSTTGTQCLGQRSRKQHKILRLARCVGAFFNKLLGSAMVKML